MKTLTSALCLLLVVLPASAQQPANSCVPNFYVPYGVRDVRVDAVEPESSSAAMWVADPGQRPNTPMPRPYPMRRARYRRFQPGYGPYPQPQISTGDVVVGVIVAFAVLAALVGGNH